MGVVTEIRENRGMVEVLVDNATLARVRKAHFDRCPLEVDDDIDPAEWLGRMAAVQFAEAYEAALSSLDRSAHTAHDLAGGLKRRGFVQPAIDAVLARLTENGLIDDARYARRMAELSATKPVGLYAFKRKLRARGISDDDAEDALAAFDDDQQRAAAIQAAQRLWKKYEALPEREARAKLSQALARRGFGWDAIEGAVEEMNKF
ncbi:MAG: RecX family transcriptional regulator [Clostridia bacterium]|nr:RecX family transcriptional regulator [Clostridia bacterium]MBR3273224.1 RecX family transcriptional regulator [Clostridia bacterium]